MPSSGLAWAPSEWGGGRLTSHKELGVGVNRCHRICELVMVITKDDHTHLSPFLKKKTNLFWSISSQNVQTINAGEGVEAVLLVGM